MHWLYAKKSKVSPTTPERRETMVLFRETSIASCITGLNLSDNLEGMGLQSETCSVCRYSTVIVISHIVFGYFSYCS